jgi:hypothetical protein
VIQELKTQYQDLQFGLIQEYEILKTFYNALIAYCAITGVVQVVTSLLTILILLSCAG